MAQTLSGFGLALVFLYSGADKARHWRESLDEVRRLGLPAPALFTAMTIVAQLAGGAAVAFGGGAGWIATCGALLLAAFTVVATLLGHRFWLLHGQTARHEFTTVLEHVAIIAGLVLLVCARWPGGG